jgi:hypothetical protein
MADVKHSLEHGSAGARRAAVMAARHHQVPGDGHPRVWQPWAKLIKEAEQRMRTEVDAALREYEAALGAAGQVLDLADTIAREAEERTARAAWEALTRQLDAAADAAAAILGPARGAYEREVGRASDDYQAAIGVARRAFERAIADAQAAEQLAGQARPAA